MATSMWYVVCAMCYGGANRMEAPYADILDRICTDLRTGRQPIRRSLTAVNRPMALRRPGEDYLRSTSPRRCTEEARNPVNKPVN
jgi:hypothetical protein